MNTSNMPQDERGVGLMSADEVAEVLKTIQPEQSAAATEPSEEVTEDELLDEESVEEESNLSYEEGLMDGLELNTEFVNSDQQAILRKREDTRSRLAIAYLIATFVIFLFAMIIAVLDGLTRSVSIIENLKEIVPLISGVFLGSLGFVLGYYFRENEENNDKPTA